MTRTIFRDFDEFAEAINGIAGRFVPTARSETDWWVQVVSAGRVAIQQVQIGGAATFVGDGRSCAFTLGIPIVPSPSIRIDGQSMREGSFILGKAGQPFTFAAGQATCWMGINVPLDHALLPAELIESLNARTRRSDGGTLGNTAQPYVASARLLASRLFAEDGSVELVDPAAARAVEEEIVAITSHALDANNRVEHSRLGRPRFSRDRIVARALELVEASEGQPLFLNDLCRVAQVSERTLRNIFLEYFGVGPMRLLKVAQLSEIRSALIAADPATQTISSIVTRFGVWDFSSFARNYKALYNETASETLRKSALTRSTSTRPARGPNAMNPTWIRFASHKFDATRRH